MTHSTAATRNRVIAANVFRFSSPYYLTAQVESIVAAAMKSDATAIAVATNTKPGGLPAKHAYPVSNVRRRRMHEGTITLREAIIAAMRGGCRTSAEIMAAVGIDRLDWKSQSQAMLKAKLITSSGQHGRTLGRFDLVQA